MTSQQLTAMYDRAREMQLIVRETDLYRYFQYTRICIRIAKAINSKCLTELF